MTDYDLAIIGGGLTGAGLAAALYVSQPALKIALIDARLPAHDDPRLFALNYSSCCFLQRVGVWDELEHAAAPIHEVHVSTAGRFGALRLKREEVTLPELGHVIPAYFIEAALDKQLAQNPNLTFYRPATLSSLTETETGVTISFTLDQKVHTLSAKFVVGADGAASSVREQLGINATTHDYAQSALVTQTHLSRSHAQIAYERFNAKGAIAMLPLKGDTCATIWTADHETIAELKAMKANDFCERLQQDFGGRLGRLLSVGERFVYPLKMIKAEKYTAERVYLLGNAAHALHPIAAQGLNLAIYEVAVFVETLLSEYNADNHLQMLSAEMFNKRCLPQQNASIYFSHLLSRCVSTDSFLWGAMTGLAFAGMDWFKPIKRRLLTRLIGRSGKVPRLLLDMN